MGERRLRVGVVGLGRGLVLARHAEAAGMEVVAICDLDETVLARARQGFARAVPYVEVDRFLEHEMDAVILANHFDEHGPLAIRALDAGKHVLSETAACRTPAEGVALVRAVERSGLVYQLAENYPFKAPVREMRRLYRAGEIGELQYAECEYLHAFAPVSLARFAPHPGHWRARISSTAYCTHSIAPVLYVSGAWPVEVAAFVVPLDASPASREQARRGRGTAALLVVRLEEGALLKSLHGFLQGESEPEALSLRIHGSRGLLETLRHGDSRRVRLRREAWAAPSGVVEDAVREASGNEALERRAGLRSDELLLCRSFAAAVRTGEPPCFDVHLGVATSLAGICGLRSIAERGASVEIPDLRREEVRRRYESDDSVGLEPLAADPRPARS